MTNQIPTEQTGTEAKTKKPEYSDISDSETTDPSSEKAAIPKDQDKPIMQLPYFDHQYSRISFYGSDITDDQSKNESNKTITEENISLPNKTEQPIYSVFKGNIRSGGGLLKPKQVQVVRPKPVIYRFKPNNGLRQSTPAYYVPHYITNSSTMVTQPLTVQPYYKPNPNIFASSAIPTQFRSPVTVLQGSVIHHPIYYVSFCEPKPRQ